MSYSLNFTLDFGHDPNIKLPTHLYKYRDWNDNYHKELLTDNVIYLASPNTFTDKRDCRLPYKFPKSFKQVYKWHYKNLKENNKDLTYKQRQQYAKFLAVTAPLLNYKERWKIIVNMQSEFNQHCGIFSVCNNRNDDVMWEKYGNDHAGFCIVYDSDKLRTVCGGRGQCHYFKRPFIDFLYDGINAKITKKIFFKLKRYEFEKEYRLTKYWIDLTKKNQKPALPNDTIVEVILGKNMIQQYKDEIKAVMVSKHPHAIITEL